MLAAVAGLVVGNLVNGALVATCSRLIPPPAGVHMNSARSVATSIHLFEPKHFVSPFLAHALGTLCGALSLCSDIAVCIIIPAPAWFIALDLVVA